MQLSVQAAVGRAVSRLKEHVETPLLDAQLLLAEVLKQPTSYLYAYPEKMLDAISQKKFFAAVERRLAGEPVAYITGHQCFWSLDLHVTSATLIPRPETELLVETILHLFPHNEIVTLADLGTGSGAIALALAVERPAWQIYATDVSENALAIAKKNAQQLKQHQVFFYHGNWCTALPKQLLDVIVSNPPYIAETDWDVYKKGLRYEPETALVAGQDGLAAVKEIVVSARRYLKPGGYLLVEHGFDQAQAVRDLMTLYGYQSIVSIMDLSGKERVTMGCFCL